MQNDSSTWHLFSKKELKTAFETHIDTLSGKHSERFNIEFYDFGKHYEDDSKMVCLINRRNQFSYGRDYSFILRVFSKYWEIIDEIEFAKWDDDNEEYFEGRLHENLKITRKRGEKEQYFQIQKNGKIIPIETKK